MIITDLVLSISASVSADIRCFSAISSLSTFDELRIWMAVSSSSILPWDADNTFRILSSMSFSCFLFSAPSTISLFLISSNCGFSSAARMPSNFRRSASYPTICTEKLNSFWALNLILKPLRRNGEVQERHLDRHLGSEVRVAELGDEVEPEIRVVLYHSVPNQDAVCKSGREYLSLDGPFYLH